MNVEGIEEYLSEFKQETYGKYDVVTVGEANGVGADQAVDWVDEDKGVFNMLFQFEATNLWEKTLGSLDGKRSKGEHSVWRQGFFLASLGVETNHDSMGKELREEWLERLVYRKSW